MESVVTPVVESFCAERGLECAPFKLSWYNAAVKSHKFQLDCAPSDSLCYVIISQPSMFEKSFLPFVSQNWSDVANNAIQDPLDQCMRQVFAHLKKQLHQFDENSLAFHDFELHANRRPKVLVQTAGHVSGAVRFYQESDADPNHLERINNSDKIFPVCLHPRFGGWFALRGVIILPHCPVPDLVQLSPPDILESREQVSHLLNLYNYHWRDGRFRDCSPTIEARYSQSQQDYFAASPGPSRIEYLSSILF